MRAPSVQTAGHCCTPALDSAKEGTMTRTRLQLLLTLLAVAMLGCGAGGSTNPTPPPPPAPPPPPTPSGSPMTALINGELIEAEFVTVNRSSGQVLSNGACVPQLAIGFQVR